MTRWLAPGRRRRAGALTAPGVCVTALLVAGCDGPAPQPAVTVTATLTVTATVTVTATPTALASEAPAPETTPAPVKAHVPQGALALIEWHDQAATNKCVQVMTVYENRSDTAVNSITQKFQTMYTPKHAEGEYPDSVDGPDKSMTQVAGIAPYKTRTLYWDVCAPELASKQNPPPADGTDSFMSEIGAQPRSFTWKWVEE